MTEIAFVLGLTSDQHDALVARGGPTDPTAWRPHMTAAATPQVSLVPITEPVGMTRFTPEQKALIKDTIARDQSLTDDELKLFLYVCERRGLDPLAKQIYAIRRKGKITHQTSIDGFRSIAARTGVYAGRDRTVFEGEAKVGDRAVPAVAVVTVYREVAGMPRPWTAEARWDEFYPGSGDIGLMYRNKPYTMLAKCAEAQALRAAFPEELGGLYTGDEMAQAGRADNLAGRRAQQEAEGGGTAEPVDPLVEAMNTPLPGKDKAWGGNAGKALNEIPSSVLGQVAKWCAKKLGDGDDSPDLLALVEACNLVLAARQSGKLADPGGKGGGSPVSAPEATSEPTAESEGGT